MVHRSVHHTKKGGTGRVRVVVRRRRLVENAVAQSQLVLTSLPLRRLRV
jgi:hypothetical protein